MRKAAKPSSLTTPHAIPRHQREPCAGTIRTRARLSQKATIMPITLRAGSQLTPNGATSSRPVNITVPKDDNILITGATGTGKTMLTTTLIEQALKSGFELAICSDADKQREYEWCHTRVRAHGWGADGLESAAATLQMLCDECDRRLRAFVKYGVANYDELPRAATDFMPRILLVAEDTISWAAPDFYGYDNIPLDDQQAYCRSVSAICQSMLDEIIRHGRFAGITTIFVTQLANKKNGLLPRTSPSFRTRITMGTYGRRAHLRLLDDDMLLLLPPRDTSMDTVSGTIESPNYPQPTMFRTKIYRPHHIPLKSDWTQAEISHVFPFAKHRPTEPAL